MAVDCIFIGDLHLTMKNPVCRTDNLFEALKSKIAFLNTMQERYNCPIFAPGDIFDASNPPHELIRYCIRHLPHLYVVPGQHDLPAHAFSEFHKSGLGVLEAAEKITLVPQEGFRFPEFKVHGFGWNADFVPIEKSDIPTIVMMHYFVYSGKEPFPGVTIANHSSHIFSVFDNADVILSGDNHQSFFLRKDKQLLLNCGSVLRTTAKQMHHVPTMCLWDSGTNNIKKVPFPFFKDVISREHITEAVKHIKKNHFIDLLDSVTDIEWSMQTFPELLSQYYLTHRTSASVQELITSYFEKKKGKK